MVEQVQTTAGSASIAESDKERTPILEVKNLYVKYPIYGGFLKKKVGEIKAVNNVSFKLYPGETLGLVGESGCGKSSLGNGLLGLIERMGGEVSGEIYYNGKAFPKKYNKTLRKEIQMIFQDPDASLNPRMKIVDIIGEPLRNLMGMKNKMDIRRRVLDLLKLVSLKAEHLDRFPHEFSGGQKQRILIARALACEPRILVLDEPTSALDVSVQAQVLNLLEKLQKKLGLAYLFITHDLSVIHHIAHRVAVMYLGKFVEVGTVEDIFYNPQHPYTQALLSARPAVSEQEKRNKIILKGEIPSPANPPSGCYFHPRCFLNDLPPQCRTQSPEEYRINEHHSVWCHKIALNGKKNE